MKRIWSFLGLVCLLCLSMNVNAQVKNTTVSIETAVKMDDSGCRMGIYHEHPNDICGEPTTSYTLIFTLSYKVEAELYGLKLFDAFIPQSEITQAGDQYTFRYMHERSQPVDLGPPTADDELKDFPDSILLKIEGKLCHIPVNFEHQYQTPPP